MRSRRIVTDRDAYIILNMLTGIGPVRTSALIEFCGSPSAIFEHSEADLQRIRGVSAALADRIVNWKKAVDPDQELAFTDRAGVQLVTLADEEYPAWLRGIHAAPLCLYIRGQIPPETETRSLAMVGTRNASRYGASMARHLAESAAYSAWITVSGLAVGIDTIVHRATLDAGGKTVAVLGGGLARFHPQENLDLARDIVSSGGAVITEFPMTTSPSRHSFPTRNRIISGLSLGTLVVEAGVNSGSLITAAHALEQGKRIFAVPGPADAAGSNGCNALIRKGAVLVENFEHILEDFEFLPGFEGKNRDLSFREDTTGSDAASDSGGTDDGALSAGDEVILEHLKKAEKLTLDALSARMPETPASSILSSLIALEILRRIRKNPDGSYTRIR